MDLKELRIIRKPVELRAVKGDDGGDVFSGYVFKWDTESEDLGGFVEVIRRGAAAAWLAAPAHNLFAILDHEKHVDKVLGDLESRTLALAEDDVGLRFEIHAGPTQAARDAAVVVGRNRVGMSFAFVAGEDRWSSLADGRRLRELLRFADLDDISIVVGAAYKSSDVSVAKRSLEAHLEAEKRYNESHDEKGQFAEGASGSDAAVDKAIKDHADAQANLQTHQLAHDRGAAATAAAAAASDKAKKSQDPADYKAAQTAHENASALHDKSGNTALAAAHKGMAASHAKIGKLLEDQAAGKERLAALKVKLKRSAGEPEKIEYRGAVPFKPTVKSQAETWDADAAEKRVRVWATEGGKIDFARYQQAFAYKTGQGDKLGDFHLPHHDISDEKLVVVWRGVAAAMTAVCGGRGGLKWEQPGDRQAVYEHLKKHYEQFDKEAPELRSQKEIDAMEKRPDIDYLRRKLDLAELEQRFDPAVEARANPHRDEDGKFHDGSIESRLATIRGRLEKAETRHAAAAAAYRDALAVEGSEHPGVVAKRAAWEEARAAHQEAIDDADGALAGVVADHEARMTEHRELLDGHKARFAGPEYANPAASAPSDAGSTVA